MNALCASCNRARELTYLIDFRDGSESFVICDHCAQDAEERGYHVTVYAIGNSQGDSYVQ